MEKIKKWFQSRKLKSEERYDEEKKEFEKSLGEPFIDIRVVMPEGFEDVRAKFLDLERDPQFLDEVKDIVKKRLLYERHQIEPSS